MLRHIGALSLAFCFISLSAVAAPQAQSSPKFTSPKLIQVSYAVTKNGQPFANVHEQFVVTDNAYKLESVTKGIGVYALFGERKLTSAGEVTSQGLKPDHFELHQGDSPKRALIADFDWLNNTLRMMVKGKQKEAELAPGTQDLASYAYQFMFVSAILKDAITVTLTTGKKLNQYQYKINAEQEVLDIAGTQYKTQHLVPAQLDQNKSETKEIWLAAEHYYLPVRILMIDENGQKLEQTLTELHVE
jgi:hypothetical protein